MTNPQTNNNLLFKVPGRKYFTEKIVPNNYKRIRERVQSQITSAKYISFTTDVWTSKSNNFSFISLTAHWLSDEFRNHHAVLNCKYFPGSHTGTAICGVLDGILAEWGITKDRVHLLIR